MDYGTLGQFLVGEGFLKGNIIKTIYCRSKFRTVNRRGQGNGKNKNDSGIKSI